MLMMFVVIVDFSLVCDGDDYPGGVTCAARPLEESRMRVKRSGKPCLAAHSYSLRKTTAIQTIKSSCMTILHLCSIPTF